MSAMGKDWDTAYQDIQNRVDKAIRERFGEKFNVSLTFSAYDSDENDIPIDNLDDCPVKGTFAFVHWDRGGWGNNGVYKSIPVENPTWLDIAVLAQEMMLITADMHHCFLEGVEETKPGVYEFIMGS